MGKVAVEAVDMDDCLVRIETFERVLVDWNERLVLLTKRVAEDAILAEEFFPSGREVESDSGDSGQAQILLFNGFCGFLVR